MSSWVVGRNRRPLGQALFSDQSQITLRMVTREDEDSDDAAGATVSQRRIAFRQTLGHRGDGIPARARRGRSAAVAHRRSVRRCLVVQSLSQAIDRLLPRLSKPGGALAPAGILARNDPKVRALEGLEQTVEVLTATCRRSSGVHEGPVELRGRSRQGQKTGLFLDQRENRDAAARYAPGRLLDCFSYNGGFALRLAALRRRSDALDISADAVARITANAARNGGHNVQRARSQRVRRVTATRARGETYDTIVLDPPAFAKNKASSPRARAGYKDINLRAMRLLKPGG